MVLALLSAVIGAVAFNIRNLIQQQKFNNDVNTIVETLNRAEQLMLIYGQGTRLKFSKQKDGIQTKIETDCKLDPKWEKWLTNNSKVLTEVHSIHFNDLTFPDRGESERTIYFYPNGGGLSKGVIGLSSAKDLGKEGALEAYICLPGYPSAIISEATPPKSCGEEPDAAIAVITRNEVFERALNEP